MFRILLLAQETSGGIATALAVLVVVFFLFFGMLVLLVSKQFKRCPPNRILVIYGKSGPGQAQCVHGGARLVVPLLQDHAWLALEPIRIEVSRQKTARGRTISDPLPRVFSVAIGTTPELMQTAAVRLLGLTNEEIARQAEDIIVAELDRRIDEIETGQLQPGTEEFYQRLESSIGAGLNELGLVLVNFRRE